MTENNNNNAPVVVVPNELPPSRIVYVLTTSEGRDKLFKLLQYMLLSAIWFLDQDNLFVVATSRENWIRRFASNLSTIRFGRCLFRLGRWLITIVYLQMSVRFLKLLLRARRRKTVGAPSKLMVALAGLMCVRGGASVCRSVVRDILFLSDSNFSSHLKLSSAISAAAERTQLILWVVTSLVDCILVEWRLSLPGWVPDLKSLRCGCDTNTALSLGVSRFEFTPTDLDFGCPHPLVPSFFSASEPNLMPVRCSKCGQIAVSTTSSPAVDENETKTNNNSNNNILQKIENNEQQQAGNIDSRNSSSAVLFVPNMVRKMFEYITILGKHGNYSEMLLLRLKTYCELVLSLALTRSNLRNSSAFSLTSESNSAALPQVFITTTGAGLISAVISLHRVWLAAK